jgi:hypothetical protein
MSRFGWSVRCAAVVLLTTVACNDGTGPGGGGDLPSRVVITPGQARLAAVGDTVRLRAGRYDIFGDPLSPRTVSWASLDPGVFTIDQGGLVTGMQPLSIGRAVATIGSEADTAYVVVANPDASPCLGYSAPVPLGVGESIDVSMTDGVCILSAAGGDEYVVVPWHGGFVGAAPVAFDVTGSGLSTLDPTASTRPVARSTSSGPQRSFAFEHGLRELGRRELMPLAQASRGTFESRKKSGSSAAAIPAYLALGDLVQLNAAIDNACGAPTMRTGRVTAISARAIIVHDTLNPAGGFTNADYQRFAIAFDTLIAPVADAAFGAPTDIDVNGKVVVFFTRAVNELTPAGADYYYGGFFHPRDLIPQADHLGPLCPGSNEREMFYMLAPDPAGAVNGNPRSVAFVDTITVGTLAHEHQHLVNFARRAYVNSAFVDEDVWLNEGLSHIAEELVFFRAAGMGPRQNIGGGAFGSESFDAMFTRYMMPNFDRLDVFLADPNRHSPYSSGDDLGTRGAAWAFLRYAADHRGGGDGDVWMRLVNSRTRGLENLANVFGPALPRMMHDWQLSLYSDDFVSGLDPAHELPSWNFRTAFPALPSTRARPYPLTAAVPALADNVPQTLSLPTGSGSYLRFGVVAGRDAVVRLTSAGVVPPSSLHATILRTR